jgi:uncharacterized protein YbjT (DUF2867 family)
MRILVIGGTGKVGLPLVQRVLEQGADVTVVSRSSERTRLIPGAAKVVLGDFIADPASLSTAFQDVDAVFMVNRASPTEAVEGTLAVRLAREAGVPRFVYQTAHLLDELAYLPHLAAKTATRKAIELSGMEYTFIAPNHFYQNDEMVQLPLVNQGLYLTPLGSVGCWCVDVRDIADAAAVVLLSEGHAGRSYNVVGPRVLTGEEAAACWARALGRDVRYAGLDRWREFTRPYLPAWLHYDLSLMYEDFGDRGMLGTIEDVEQLTKLIGRPPRSFEAYTAEQASRWNATPG